MVDCSIWLCTIASDLSSYGYQILKSAFCFRSREKKTHFLLWMLGRKIEFLVVLERTVRYSRIVWFFMMFDMFKVWFWTKMWCSEVFEVRSCCYVTRLVLELTVCCLRTVQVFVMFDMFEVRFWAKMWCLESSMFGHSMFGVLEVQYFGVRSKTNF